MDPNKRSLITDLSAVLSANADYQSRKRRSHAASRHAVALRGGGFTLVELLIATGITVLMVVMLGWMLGSLMGSASHATQRVDAFRDARAALQMIERDLRNLVRGQWSPDPFTNPTPASTPQPVTLPAAYFAAANVWQDPNDPYSTSNPNAQIFALISVKPSGSAPTATPTATPTASGGDVCAVGYYCRWDNQLHAYSLRRFFRDSTATFSVMQGAGSYATDSALYNLTAQDAKNDVLAAYVWNFKLAMYDSAGTVINTYPYVCDPNATTPQPLPAAIEISFNAMSPQAAQAVMSVTAGMTDSAAAAYWMNMDANLVKPHAYQFRSRINLP
jgi:type II secretory pathway pseudopilin PulG